MTACWWLIPAVVLGSVLLGIILMAFATWYYNTLPSLPLS